MSTHTQPTLISSLLTTHPGKALWTLFALTLNTLRLPLWMVYYIPTFTRPHPRWTYAQAVRVRIVRAFLWNVSLIEMKTPLSLLPGKEKDRFVVLPPASSSTYIDVLTKDPAIQPGQVGATWYPHAPTQSDKSALSNPALTEKVVLHFHGGAYAIGDGRTDDAGFASKTFVDNTSASFVCCPQYRLSSNADGRFPAQLQDAVTSYAYLVRECGIPANKIVLSGDSAGANLALALVKYLTVCGKDAGFEERLPACAWLWSIWANPGTSVKMGEAALDSVPNKRRDYVGGGFGLWGARNLIPLPASGLDIESPWISFGGNPFRTDIPLYVSTGECEVLIRDDIQVYEEFNAIKGNRVELQVEEDCVHDVILAGKLMGFEKEAQRCAQRGEKFLQSVTNKASL